MPKLWHKDYELDKEVEKFEVGDDLYLDNRLVRADVYGSIAHAKMLASIGWLTESEFQTLKKGLAKILELEGQGQFQLQEGDEDVHTKIEIYLTQTVGDAGKKIHVARSRNDQVLVDLRLYAKEKLLEVQERLLELCGALSELAEKHALTPMPGYTHMQRAMLSSVGLWAGAFMESFLDDLELLKAAYRLNDQCPLGSAAAYGVPINIDRELTSKLLGFARVQNNVLYCQNARGKFEGAALQALAQVAIDMSRLAQDIMLFTTSEYGFFKVADELCTGSSIMPQKKNVDTAELLRGKAKVMLAYQDQALALVTALPSGYNKDLQDTKRPFIEGIELALSSLRICYLTVKGITVNEERLAAACSPELFAADKAYEMVKQGMTFRDAYKKVGLELNTLKGEDPREAIKRRTHIGAAGNLGIAEKQRQIESEMARVEQESESYKKTMAALLEL